VFKFDSKLSNQKSGTSVVTDFTSEVNRAAFFALRKIIVQSRWGVIGYNSVILAV
jgi:hypothetical protein